MWLTVRWFRLSLNGLVGSIGLVDSLVDEVELTGGSYSVGGLVWWVGWFAWLNS